MRYITIDYIIKLHKKMIDVTGGLDGIRDIELLKSAVENAKATFGGTDLYPTVEDKYASICYSIINNHAFVDGNKRVGLYVMLVLLEYNGIRLTFSQEELIDLGFDVAKGLLKQQDIVKWINERK
jgi:death-on-curing protein